MAAVYDRTQFVADYKAACQEIVQAFLKLSELQQRAINCHFDDEVNALAANDTQWDSTPFTKIMYLEVDSAVTQLKNYWNGAAVASAAYGEKIDRVANAIAGA